MSESKIKEEKVLALKAIEKQTEAYKNLAEIINKELESEGELSDKSSKRLKDYIEKNIESLTMFEPELTSSEIFNRVIKESQFTKIINGANGYLAYDNWNKKYVYHVTKDPISAVAGVLANGWGSAGAGFGPQTGGPSGKL